MRPFIILACVFALTLTSSAVASAQQEVRFAGSDDTLKGPYVGLLIQPAGTGPFPAVVLLHGCGGTSPRDKAWAARLTAWGFAVLHLDSLSPRGQPDRPARIGVLLFNTPESHPNLSAFRTALGQLGYVEGQNIVFDYRSAESNSELPVLAAELVNRRPDAVVVPSYTPAMQAAKAATRAIPIVVVTAGDPVGSGLVAKLARPGGNVTGLTVMSPDLAGKRLELLKEILPRLVRVAVLWNPGNPPKVAEWHETEVAATRLGLKLQSLEVQRLGDFDRAFAIAQKDRADALIALSDPLLSSHRQRIVDFANVNRLPSIYTFRDFVDAGGLVAYGPSSTDLFRRAAVYVDKILRGAKPADLPVEQPTKFDLAINLRTAKAIGRIIPPSLLLRADYVVE